MRTTYPKEAGIYKLTCRNNGKIYIGKAVNIQNRLSKHRYNSQKFPPTYYFEFAIVKHGWESFDVEILEIFENFNKKNEEHKKLILEKESDYIKLYNSTDNKIGYNTCKYSNDTTGQTRSAETKEKMRNAQLGKTHSEETKEKIRQLKTGVKYSTETRTKMRNSRLGKPMSDETKAKMRALRLGQTHTPETIERMRQAKLGKIKGPHSEETKEKIRQAHIGMTASDEAKEKMSKFWKGTKRSEEIKKKISEGLKRYARSRSGGAALEVAEQNNYE